MISERRLSRFRAMAQSVRIAKFGVLALVFIIGFGSRASAFAPCSPFFPDGLGYIPSVSQCNGRAGIVVWGELKNAFSVVVRDCKNNDRDPCNKSDASCGSNFSSPFKAQSIIPVTIQRQGQNRVRQARLFCMKERGDSEVYKLVRRITIKKVNPVRRDSDIARICLSTRTRAVRPLTIVSAGTPRSIAGTGFSPVCNSQPYLACDFSYERICLANF